MRGCCGGGIEEPTEWGDGLLALYGVGRAGEEHVRRAKQVDRRAGAWRLSLYWISQHAAYAALPVSGNPVSTEARFVVNVAVTGCTAHSP